MKRTTEWGIFVVGGANTDYLVRGPHLPKPGETVKGNVFREDPGGKGANQAIAAARLGAHVAFAARVGLDARGEAIRAQLEQEKVDVRHLFRDAQVSTGVALIQVDVAGQKQILSAAGANQRLSVGQVEKAKRDIQAARILLTQLEVSLDCVKRAAQLAHDAGVQVFLDPAPAVPLPDELLRLVELIKPNSTEAEILTGIEVHDRDSARRAAQYLLDHGVQTVAVEAGDAGNLIVTREEEHFLPLIPVESVDATGAGDAFIAALAVARTEGRGWQEAGELASAAAALTTTHLGAQVALPTRDEVFALISQVREKV